MNTDLASIAHLPRRLYTKATLTGWYSPLSIAEAVSRKILVINEHGFYRVMADASRCQRLLEELETGTVVNRVENGKLRKKVVVKANGNTPVLIDPEDNRVSNASEDEVAEITDEEKEKLDENSNPRLKAARDLAVASSMLADAVTTGSDSWPKYFSDVKARFGFLQTEFSKQ